MPRLPRFLTRKDGSSALSVCSNVAPPPPKKPPRAPEVCEFIGLSLYRSGMSTLEVARALGCREAAVYNRVFGRMRKLV
jgi:hypothetical protein